MLRGAPEGSLVSETVAVASNRYYMTVVQQAIDERCRHNLIAEDSAPFLKAFVRGQYRRGGFVAPSHELEEEHRPGSRDGQVADLDYN